MATSETPGCRQPGLRIIHPFETPSTNNYATDLITAGNAEEGCLILTYRQTNGRGHGKNRWETEEGKNLTFSLILEPRFLKAADQFILSKVISLALAGFLDEKVKKQPFNASSSGITSPKPENQIEIKWPNDILAGNRKIAGILIENRIMGSFLQWSVAGIGLNINQSSFPEYLSQATSLRLVTDCCYDLRECLEELTKHIFCRYEELREGNHRKIHEQYLERLFGKEYFYTYRMGSSHFDARVEGVDQYGRLKLRDKSGRLTVWPFKGVELLSYDRIDQ